MRKLLQNSLEIFEKTPDEIVIIALIFQSNRKTSPQPNNVNRILIDMIITLFSTINLTLTAMHRTDFPSPLSPVTERKNRGITWKKNTLTIAFNCQNRGQEHVHRLWSASMNHAAV